MVRPSSRHLFPVIEQPPDAEPVYRLAETEWKAFVEHFTDLLSEADPQIPPLPPKDVIHRIYRDVSSASLVCPLVLTVRPPDPLQQRQDSI